MATGLKHRISNTGNLLTNTTFNELNYTSNSKFTSSDIVGKLDEITNKNGSLFFTGLVTNNLSYADNPLWQLNDTFTISCWVYVPENRFNLSVTGFGHASVCAYSTSGLTNWDLYIDSTSTPGKVLPKFLWYNTAVTGYTATHTTTIPYNTWTHLAVTKESNSLKVFINGVAGTPVTTTGTSRNGVAQFNVGCQAGSVWPFAGFISQLALIKGTNYFPTNFTVPTDNLPILSNTAISLYTTMSAPYKDYSNNNLTPTITGRVQAHPNSPSTLINNSLPLRISNNGTILVKSQYDEASGI